MQSSVQETARDPNERVLAWMSDMGISNERGDEKKPVTKAYDLLNAPEMRFDLITGA